MRKIWRAKDVRSGPTSNLTLVTAASMTRLDALEAQCQSYTGPLSAAVYVPLAAGVHKSSELIRAVDQLSEMFVRTERSQGCQLHALMLVTEEVDLTMASLIPINALRNMALAAASTTLVMMIDVDLMVSRALDLALALPPSHPLSYSSILESCRGSATQRPVAWILPAYETPKLSDLKDGIKLVEAAVRGPKANLGGLIASGTIQSFASVFYPKGHACTDFKQWFNAASPDPIEVSYSVNCEPWFIIDRLKCPPYDARFRGYGWNKVQQVAHVNSSGFRFVLHPHAFIIHRPHPKSSAQGFYTSVTTANASSDGSVSPGKLFHRKVASMRHVALRDMKRGTYRPVVDPGSERCFRGLPWWSERRQWHHSILQSSKL